jgi:hypothetical protein
MPMLPGYGVSPQNFSLYFPPSWEGVRGWWTLIAETICLKSTTEHGVFPFKGRGVRFLAESSF